jgi:transcriptional regulator with XRE-family HTH domain
MTSQVGKLLEAKRAERKETKLKFCKYLSISGALYNEILYGRKPIPGKKLEGIAATLEISVEELEALSKGGKTKKVLVRDREVSGDELRYLAGIADAAGVRVKLSILLPHLEHFPK